MMNMQKILVCLGVLECALFKMINGCDNTGKVCFYGPTYDLSPSICGNYVSYASGLGYTTEVISTATWNSWTTADFSECNAIVFCDPSCSGDETILDVAANNNNIWLPAVDGNVFIIGGDEAYHGYLQGKAGGQETVEKGMDFVLADTNCDLTGLYVSLSCYYFGQDLDLPLLDYWGVFDIDVRGSCDEVHVVEEIDQLDGLEDSDFDGWGCAIHNVFASWPSDFDAFAIDTLAGLGDGTAITFPDGSQGKGYILTRGDGDMIDTCKKYDLGPCDNQPCDCVLDDMINCDICHSNGCDQCKSGFWKLDYNHKCVSCDMFGDGCMFCQDHHGCGQCKTGYHRIYNALCGVWECLQDEENIDCNTDSLTMHLDMNQCIMPCYDTPGMVCSCADICDCNVCHEGQGCAQCDNGYFKIDNNHPCINCQEYFGNACLHCQDHHGCGQCAQGYNLVYDETCDVYKCQ